MSASYSLFAVQLFLVFDDIDTGDDRRIDFGEFIRGCSRLGNAQYRTRLRSLVRTYFTHAAFSEQVWCSALKMPKKPLTTSTAMMVVKSCLTNFAAGWCLPRFP